MDSRPGVHCHCARTSTNIKRAPPGRKAWGLRFQTNGLHAVAPTAENLDALLHAADATVLLLDLIPVELGDEVVVLRLDGLCDRDEALELVRGTPGSTAFVTSVERFEKV